MPRSRYRPLLCDTDRRARCQINSISEAYNAPPPISLSPTLISPNSYYLGMASDMLERIVRRDLLPHFFENLHRWMPSEACSKHSEKWMKKKLSGLEFEQRECCKKAEILNAVTPLLFKREFLGCRAISLCSKTYYIDGQTPGEFKMAAKGLSRKSNDITFEHFRQCLVYQRNCVGSNQGIQKWRRADRALRMCTYQKIQDVLSCFYAKRVVDR